MAHDYPAFMAACFVSNEEALRRIVKSHTRLAAGFATSEPHTFYEQLWDFIVANDLRDISLRQALFMAPYKLCIGDALSSKGLFSDAAKGRGLAGGLAKKINGPSKKIEGLRKLIAHYEALRARDIRLVNSFLGPTSNGVLPDSALVRALFPEYAGRNSARMGVTDTQNVHFPFALEALGYTPEHQPLVDSFVTVMTPPNAGGEMSLGLANGANGELMETFLERADVTVLVYVNPRYPFTYGYGDSPNSFHTDRFEKLAKAGRLLLVHDDGPLPSLPKGAFANPSKDEQQIAQNVVNHIELKKEKTYGRAIQVGIGQTGVQAIKALQKSSWWGRQYSEMFEAATLELFEQGKIKGTHFIEKSGTRTEVDGKVIATFTMAEEGSDFYAKLNENKDICLPTASRVVIPEGFFGGLGINNALAIDFSGQINSGSRDKNPYSGIGGLGMIARGLARGGIGYFCLKSTHKTPEGKLRSSIFPYLPEGSQVSLIGPDTSGACGGARFYLVTEWGIADLTGVSQSQLIKNLIGVAHPQFRDWLKKCAWQEYRVKV